MDLSHLVMMMLLFTGGGTGTRRQPWDLKGKVSDMEDKIRNYQTKFKSVNQENEDLKGSMVQSRTKLYEVEKQLERELNQIRCKK